jgi:hypothetical protein
VLLRNCRKKAPPTPPRRPFAGVRLRSNSLSISSSLSCSLVFPRGILISALGSLKLKTPVMFMNCM